MKQPYETSDFLLKYITGYLKMIVGLALRLFYDLGLNV